MIGRSRPRAWRLIWAAVSKPGYGQSRVLYSRCAAPSPGRPLRPIFPPASAGGPLVFHLGGEDLPSQRALAPPDGAWGGGQPRALLVVGGQDGIDRVRRQRP